MAAVQPPNPTYTPNLPRELIENGKLSLAQLEAVVYAGQSHKEILPGSNARKGFFIGDGTGVGKGREISGIILDNLRQGRNKAVWISKNAPLFDDARRDYGDIGGNSSDVFSLNKIKQGTDIKNTKGVLFTTYDTLKEGLETVGGGESVAARTGRQARIDQVIRWLGEDFDGVIAFDEAHNMGNSIPKRGKRGKTKPALKALAGIELQRRLPNARVVYVSATGATEVDNLAFAERLGLWGTGTAFANKSDFINKIHSGGLAAMEMVAKDMKALGLYIARSLDFNGVTYDTLTHDLTPEQTEIYDEMARAWQIVLQNINEAIAVTNCSGRERGGAMAKFWGAEQRFFNQIITSMQMPSVINRVRDDLSSGNAVVMQLVNTNEATQNRQLANRQGDEELEDLDLTPRDILIQYLERSFPVLQYEPYTDENDAVRYRLVLDSQGNPVENQEAVAKRDALLERVGSLKVPEGPLEIVLNVFGANNVAEITGRRQRVVRIKDEDSGRTKSVRETRSPKHIAADAQAFMDDKKQILIFSDAGGTGRSYHASLEAKNQRRRIHYLIQAGWRADNAVQGFGRTHRTNQASAPEYVLVTTNLKGQKRFISSIARRLDQLGALTKGQRQTGSQGLFSAKDNLESTIAVDALTRFYRLVASNLDGQVGYVNLDGEELLQKMGLSNIVDEDGNLVADSEALRDIPKFLNRILALESSEQNKVFDTFYDIMERLVEEAAARGELDSGLENYRADGGITVSQGKTVYTEEKSGAETKYIGLEAKFKNKTIPYGKAIGVDNFLGIYKNTRSGRVVAVRRAGHTTLESGDVVVVYEHQAQTKESKAKITEPTFRRGNWEEIKGEDAEKAWNNALAQVSEHRTENLHLITGALLPIWNRLPQGRVRVIRLKTDDGRMFLGRLVSEREIDTVLRRLGADRERQQLSPQELVNRVLRDRYTIYLSNEWRIVRRVVANENRIEITGNDLYQHTDQLRNEGVFVERIGYTTRYFIPTGDDAAEVLEKVIRYRPVADVVAPEGRSAGGGGQQDYAEHHQAPGPGRSGLSLGDIQERMNRKINDEIGDVKPAMGMSVQWVNKKPKAEGGKKEEGYSFKDPGIEERFQAANGIPGESYISRLKEAWRSLINKAHREYEHLPRNAEFAELRAGLLNLAKQRGVRGDQTLRDQQGITINLDKYQFDIFRRHVILADLMEELEAGHNLPFGFNEDTLPAEWKRIQAEADKYPEVRRSIDDRKMVWDAIIEEYTKYQRAIGHRVDNRFTRAFYYRHQVIEYAMQKRRAVYGAGQKLKTPAGRGFLKQRGGSEMDINTNYLQAEYEVMAQMLYDIEVAKTIKLVKDQYNIRKKLDREAKEMNQQRMDGVVAGAEEDEAAAMVAAALKGFRKRIAMSFSQLSRLAETGELWTGENDEYEEVIDRLADNDVYENADEAEISRNRLFGYLAELMARDDVGSAQAATILKAVSGRREFIKEVLGKNFKTWEDLIPEGYVAWQPREGNIFFFSDTIPGHMAQKLFADQIAQLGISKDTINKMLTVGGRRDEYVVKEEVAATLDNLTDTPDDKLLLVLSEPIRAWKIWQLVSPRRWFKYNFRNLSGDAEALFVGNPAAFKKIPQAINELYAVFKGDKPMTPDMKDWFQRGGMQTLLQVQEFGDIDNLRMFIRLQEKKSNLAKLPLKVWQGYWKAARVSTDFREAILRYSAYLSFIEGIRKNGRITNFAASIPEEVMALKDEKDQAFKLANELLGAYDEVSVLGQGLRKYLMPFWSWNEVNFRRTVQLFKNAARDEKFSYAVGRKMIGTAAIRAPLLAMKVGKLTIMASALWVILSLYNNLRFPDEEKELSNDVKSRPHIIFGRDKDGKILYFDRLGFVQDFLAWFGMDDAPLEIPNLINGKVTPKEFVINFAKAPVNKLVQSIGPTVKWPVELLLGKTVFPDVFKTRSIRDRWEYFANGLGLGNEYKMLAGKPVQAIEGSRGKGYLGTVRDIFTYSADPGQSAYYDTLDAKRKFQKKIGKLNEGSFISPKGNALYNFKLAIRYNDREAARKYLLEYGALGGTTKGLESSLRTMDPLYGLSKEDKVKFVTSLNAEEKEKLVRAWGYYQAVLLGKE
jgi:hypothetical protein